MMYHVLTDREKDERGYKSDHSVLVGPDFECVLTGPEDRNWGRDGRFVVDRLNALHEELAVLKSRNNNVDSSS